MKPNHTNVQAIPDDYGSLVPYVVVRGAVKFLDFLKEAFGAVERGRGPSPDDDSLIGHAEVWLGNRVLMLFDAKENWPDTPSFLTLWVEDCDAVHHQALKAGATEITKLGTGAFGFRGSRIRDPFGNIWWIQTYVENVDDEEMMRRMDEQEYILHMRDAVETFDKEMSTRRKS